MTEPNKFSHPAESAYDPWVPNKEICDQIAASVKPPKIAKPQPVTVSRLIEKLEDFIAELKLVNPTWGVRVWDFEWGLSTLRETDQIETSIGGNNDEPKLDIKFF